MDFRQTMYGIAITGTAWWFAVHAYGPASGGPPEFAAGAQVRTIESFAQHAGEVGFWRWSGSTSSSRTVVQLARGHEYEFFTPGQAAAAVRVPYWVPGDWDFSGSVNSADIAAFLTAWMNSMAHQSLDADFNVDNVVNSQDIAMFIHAWLGQ